MRELTQRDALLLKNIEKMLKQVQFRAMDFEEALAVGQTYSYLKGLISEVEASIVQKQRDEKLKEALAQAKEVTPVTDSLKDQAPIPQPKAKGKK